MKKNNGRETRPTEIDFTEGSTSDLAAELVVAANDAFHVFEGSRRIYCGKKRREKQEPHKQRVLL
jgi:hypothetical protein